VIPGDREIRSALIASVREGRGEAAVVLEEIGLCYGSVRVDVLVVDDTLHGYEIKSDRDSLHRLSHQSEKYNAMFDSVTLVAGARHIDKAMGLVPAWWEVILATATENTENGSIGFSKQRIGSLNPGRNRRVLAELLWLGDAIEFLDRRNAARGVRGKPRSVVWDRVCEVYSLDEIAAEVRAQLKARPERLAQRIGAKTLIGGNLPEG